MLRPVAHRHLLYQLCIAIAYGGRRSSCADRLFDSDRVSLTVFVQVRNDAAYI